MKRILSILAITVSVLSNLCAMPAQHKLFPIVQPDGSTVMLYKNGHDGLAFYTTPDDKVVVRNLNGYLCYATISYNRFVASSMLVHDEEYRTAEERDFVASLAVSPYTSPETTNASVRRAMAKSPSASSDDGLGEYGKSGSGAVPSIGTVNIPVLMVEFKDKEFLPGNTVEFMQRYLTEEGFSEATNGKYTSKGSARDYFRSQSFGKFDPQFKIVAKVKVSHDYAYYGANNEYGSDSRPRELVQEAIKLAKNSGVDFTVFKMTNGKIPLISVIYAGDGEASGGDENTIWPHEYDFTFANNKIEGLYWGAYFVGNETDNSKYLSGIGCFAHEFGHALGLPDFYDTSYTNRDKKAMGSWDIMDSGGYNCDQYIPMGYSAYERSYMGWLNIPELKDAQCVTLADPNSTVESQCAVMLRNPKDNREYFILENRQPGDWCQASTGSGLMVTRVAYDRTYWTSNCPNNDADNQRAKIITPGDATIGSSAQPAHLYGNGIFDRTDFKWLNGTAADLSVYQVNKRTDGSLVFCFKQRNMFVESEKNVDQYRKITSLDELATNDVAILVNEDENMALGAKYTGLCAAASIVREGDIVYGNDRVVPLTFVKTAKGTWGIKTTIDGKVYLLSAGADGALNAASKTDANSLANITVSGAGAEIKFTTTYSAGILGYTTDNTRFACFNTADGHRIHIYKKYEDTSGIAETVSAPAADAPMYNVSGQKVGDDYKGIVIVNGKKVLRR